MRPTSTGYTYFNEVSEISASASQNLLSLSVGKFGGSTQVFAGGATRLFKLDSSDGSLDDVSKVVLHIPQLIGGHLHSLGLNF